MQQLNICIIGKCKKNLTTQSPSCALASGGCLMSLPGLLCFSVQCPWNNSTLCKHSHDFPDENCVRSSTHLSRLPHYFECIFLVIYFSINTDPEYMLLLIEHICILFLKIREYDAVSVVCHLKTNVW